MSMTEMKMVVKRVKNGGDDLLRNNRRYDDNAQFVSRITDIESEVRQINDNTAGYINGHANGLNRELNHLRETNDDIKKYLETNQFTTHHQISRSKYNKHTKINRHLKKYSITTPD